MGKFLNPWVDPRVERVHPHQIEKYVLGHRWTARESGYSTVRVFEPPYRAEYYPILSIWQDLTDPGYVDLVCRTITDIAKFEDRWAVDVLNEILAQPTDEPLNGVHSHSQSTTSAT